MVAFKKILTVFTADDNVEFHGRPTPELDGQRRVEPQVRRKRELTFEQGFCDGCASRSFISC